MIADGYLTDVIRRLSAFGLTLLPLDFRQESTRHSEALDAITRYDKGWQQRVDLAFVLTTVMCRYLGIGSYLQWDEETRLSWLLNELVAKRPLLPKENSLAEFNFSDTVVDTLETFRVLPEVNEESLGAYIISMAKRSSDVLAVKVRNFHSSGTFSATTLIHAAVAGVECNSLSAITITTAIVGDSHP